MSRGGKMLLEAADVVTQRGITYGSARKNMQRTADLWAPILGAQVTPVQVALCLIALKMARLVESPTHADSALDIAGYAAVLKDCQE